MTKDESEEAHEKPQQVIVHIHPELDPQELASHLRAPFANFRREQGRTTRPLPVVLQDNGDGVPPSVPPEDKPLARPEKLMIAAIGVLIGIPVVLILQYFFRGLVDLAGLIIGIVFALIYVLVAFCIWRAWRKKGQEEWQRSKE